MKLTFSALLLGCMCTSAAVRSQDKKISIDANRTSIASVLNLIERKSPYKFTYSNNLFPAQAIVSVNAVNKPVSEILKQTLEGTGFSYELLDNDLIAITSKENLSSQQDYEIKGTITDDKGQVLPGATIQLKASAQTVCLADAQGKYRLQAKAGAVLIINYIGFNSQEITVTGNATINIKMQTSFGALDEVVVVGYGKQTKATLTGSVSSVAGNEVAAVPSANITNALAGRLSGLISYTLGGQPGGDNSTLLIRGLSTTGDNSPLIVIDGVVRSNFSGVNSLSYIDANDIESISILKDAAATAVYGARAANGVIMVVTKQGAEGLPVISYSANVSIQKASFVYRPVDSYTTALFWNEAWKNENAFTPTDGGAKGFSDKALDAIKNGTNPDRYSNTNWYKLIFGTTPVQNVHNLSVSGGSSKAKYFISAGYLNQQGFYTPSTFKRYNIRANFTGKVANNLDFAVNLSGRQESTTDSYGAVTNSLSITPLLPVQYNNGTYSFDPSSATSPYAVSRGEDGYKNGTRNYFESSASLIYTVPHVNGLSVKGQLSVDKYYFFNKNFSKNYKAYTLNDDNSYTLPATLAGVKPSLNENYAQPQSISKEVSVNYAHSFGLHNVSGLMLYTQTKNTNDSFYAGRVNFPSSILDQLDQGSLTGLTNGGSASENGREGYVGRLNYNYNLKYLAEFSFRNDGSDLFPPGHRYGFFPAVSAGWRLSEERFIKDNFKFITNLKLRGSWGQAGNDRAGAFQYLNTYYFDSSSYGFGGTAGAPVATLSPSTIANPVFSWEKATTTNIGLEANLWKNLLRIDIDMFQKRTSDILISLASQVPLVIGGTLPVENFGIVENKGIEIQLSHQSNIGVFEYFVRPTFTFNRSKVLRYPQPANVPQGQQLQGRPVSPDAVIGYIAKDLYQSQEEINSGPTPLYPNVKPGDIRYEDINGDGKITAADRVVIYKGRTPGIIYGLNIGFSYKAFDFNAFFQGASDVVTLLPGQLNGALFSGTQVAFPLQVDHWTTENTDASFPRLTVTSVNNQQVSSFWRRNAEYVRLKSIEMGYKLPNSWAGKIGLKEVRFNVSGTNLFTLSHLKNIADPESFYSSYPLVKVFNFGINVKI